MSFLPAFVLPIGIMLFSLTLMIYYRITDNQNKKQ